MCIRDRLQTHRFGEPVEHHAGDLGPVLGPFGLGLDDARDDHELLGLIRGDLEVVEHLDGLADHGLELGRRRILLGELVSGREEVTLDVASG